MADEGDAIRDQAKKMRAQVVKVNAAAATRSRQRAVQTIAWKTKKSGGKAVTIVRRRV